MSRREDPEDRPVLEIEVQAEIDPNLRGRLALYAWQLRLDLQEGYGQAGKPLVHSILLNLTGPEQVNLCNGSEPFFNESRLESPLPEYSHGYH